MAEAQPFTVEEFRSSRLTPRSHRTTREAVPVARSQESRTSRLTLAVYSRPRRGDY